MTAPAEPLFATGLLLMPRPERLFRGVLRPRGRANALRRDASRRAVKPVLQNFILSRRDARRRAPHPVLGLGWRIADADEEDQAAYVHEMEDAFFFYEDTKALADKSIAALFEHQRTHGKKRKAPAPAPAPATAQHDLACGDHITMDGSVGVRDGP